MTRTESSAHDTDEKTFHAEPDAEQGFDYVVCESTYGDRERDDYTLEARREALEAEHSAALALGKRLDELSASEGKALIERLETLLESNSTS